MESKTRKVTNMTCNGDLANSWKCNLHSDDMGG